MIPILAAISGDSIVSALIQLVCLGLVFWLLSFLIGYVNLQEPFNRVAKVILMVAAVIVLINCIMSIGGHPLWRWN